MEVWQEALKIALIGTERQDPTSLAAQEPIKRLSAGWNMEEKERILLRVSGVLTAYRRAGYRPLKSREALPVPAEADEKAVVPGILMQDLMAMVGGQYREALPEWLQVAAERGWRLPNEHLVELLEFGRGHPEIRASLLPLLGMRGRWLAAQNPDWQYALQFSLFEIENAWDTEAAGTEETAQVWQTGTKEERVALLHRLRRSDPTGGRALVESTWKQEVPTERAEFLATFLAGLSMEDEPFLETALDDKRKEVRIASQDLLVRLPESRLCVRMWERVSVLVHLQAIQTEEVKPEAESGFWNQLRTRLTPASAPTQVEKIIIKRPQECDKAMVRDGIDLKSPSSLVEDRTWWLMQMLKSIPLTFWSTQWNRSPEAILEANRSGEWQKAFLDAWTSALRNSHDQEWASLLFASWIEQDPSKMPTDLIWQETLPQEVFVAGLEHLLEHTTYSNYYGTPAMTLLAQYKRPWSISLTRAALKRFSEVADRNNYITGIIGAYIPYVHEDLRAGYFAFWTELAEKNNYSKNQLETYLALDAFRNEMRRKMDDAA